MKSKFSSKSNLLAAAAFIVLCTSAAHAGTVPHTFSFQQGDLRQDGTSFGTGASYAGVVDGHIVDANTTGVLTSGVTATIGNQFQTLNGRNFVGLFSYDLTELNTFITTNTSATSSVAITSVAFKLVASGSTVGTAHAAIGLYRTDPFTSGATWPTTDGSTAWSSPYQNLAPPSDTATFGFTGGGSALTSNLGTASPSTASQSAGSVMQWTSSVGFVSALNYALGQPDKKLYLMAARGLQNSDGRVPVNSSNAATVDNRPELVIGLEVTTTAAPATWTGGTDTSWNVAGNWSPSGVPATDAPIIFNSSSTANLNTVLNQDFTVTSVTVTSPTGAVSIGGANTLNVGAGGIDLTAATQDLTITAPVGVTGTQNWNVASGRTLSVNGGVSGSSLFTVAGDGKVSLGGVGTYTGDTTVATGGTLKMGASNVLPNGSGKGNLVLSGTLGLNGTSQSINGLSGSGIVDNTAVGTATLTLGNNNAAGTFSGVIQDTGGDVAIVKTGSGGLTLTGPNTFAGGFTNNGTGNVIPNNDSALGTGPVVSNAGRIYPTATTVFTNSLALNNSTLQIGGGGSKTITWNAPVTATGTSGINADGGTAGITLGNTLSIAGATFSSFANATTNTLTGNISAAGGTLNATGGTLNIDGNISGAGSIINATSGTLNINGGMSGAGSTLNAAGGTIQVSGTGTYTGNSTLSGAGVLRLQPTGTISSSSNVVIDGTGNFNVRNTVSWVYTGTISGAGTGQINLNSGTDAELAGPVSGVANINANTTGTDTTISGNISDGTSAGTNVTVQSGGGILRLGGNNSYTGTSSVVAGTLVLESANALPSSPVSITNGTLDATVVGTDTTGTLNVAGTATINLAAGANLAFADSSSLDPWTGGTLNITGAFVSGSSLRFGTSNAGLTSTQLGKITLNGGGGPFALDASGYLITAPAGGYSAWQTANSAAGAANLDHDNDGVANGVEYFLGGNTSTTGFTPLPGVVTAGSVRSVTWAKASTGVSGTYGTEFVVETSTTLGTGSWTPVSTDPNPNVPNTVYISGNNLTYTFPTGPVKSFARLKVTP